MLNTLVYNKSVHKGLQSALFVRTLIISVNTEGPPLKYHYLMGILCPSAKIAVRKFKKTGYAAHFATQQILQKECDSVKIYHMF